MEKDLCYQEQDQSITNFTDLISGLVKYRRPILTCALSLISFLCII